MKMHSPEEPSLRAREQLAPRDVIRFAIAVSQAASTVWATKSDGNVAGVTVDLSMAASEWFRIPFEIVEYPSSGAIVEAAGDDEWDATFIPVDTARKEWVDYGPNYVLGGSTFLVRAESSVHVMEDVDAVGVRVVGIENTATLRSVRRVLMRSDVRGVSNLGDALAVLAGGEVDALALGRESLRSLLPLFPGARILDGDYHATGTAVAVPKGREAALAALVDFVEQMKASGSLRAILDKNGMSHIEVAPLGSFS